MNWGDELCGKKIDPRDCEGWIVSVKADGRWYEVLDIGHADKLFSLGWGNNELWSDCEPVFPRAGWAGKTDAELWAAVFGLDEPYENGRPCLETVVLAGMFRLDYDAREDHDQLCYQFDLSFDVDNEKSGAPGGIPVGEIPALILALQSAQVLAQRLRGDK